MMIIYGSFNESVSSERSSTLSFSCWVGWGGERGKVGLAVSGVAQVEGKAGDAGSLTVTLWKYITVSAWLNFSKKKSFYTVPTLLSLFNFRDHILESSKSLKKSKKKMTRIIRTLLPDCLMLICFLALLSLHLPYYLALVWKHSSPSSCLLLIPIVHCLLSLEFLQDSYLETL